MATRTRYGFFASSLALLSVSSVAEAAPDDAGVSMNRDCGVFCVGLVLRLLNERAPAFGALKATLDPEDSGTTTFLAMTSALEAEGVQCNVVATLDAVGHAWFIAVLPAAEGDGPAHFAVGHRNDRGFTLYDPPITLGTRSANELAARAGGVFVVCRRSVLSSWSLLAAIGAVAGVIIGILAHLLASRRRASLLAALALFGSVGCGRDQASTSGLSVEPSDYVRLGVVAPGLHEVKTAIVNHTSTEQKIVKTASSCGCAGIVGDMATPLQPGESRAWVIKIRVPPERRNVVAARWFFEQHPPLAMFVEVTGDRTTHYDHAKTVVVDAVVPGVAQHVTLNVKATAGAPADATWQVAKGIGVRILSSGATERGAGTVLMWAECEIMSPWPGRGVAVVDACVADACFQSTVIWDARYPCAVTPEVVVMSRDMHAGVVTINSPHGWSIADVTPSSGGLSVSRTGEAVTINATGEWMRCGTPGALRVTMSTPINVVRFSVPVVPDITE